MKRIYRSVWLAALLLFGGIVSAAGQPDEQPDRFGPPPDLPDGKPDRFGPPPGPPPDKKERDGRRPWMRSWGQVRKVFDQLPEAERQKMVLLMKEDPEEFRKIMLEKLVELEKEMQREFGEMRALIRQYQNSADKAEQETLRRKVHEKIAAEFQRQLKEHRNMLEEMRKRLKDLEEKYQYREKNADKIIDARLEFMLKHGLELPPPPPPEREMGFPPPEEEMLPPLPPGMEKESGEAERKEIPEQDQNTKG